MPRPSQTPGVRVSWSALLLSHGVDVARVGLAVALAEVAAVAAWAASHVAGVAALPAACPTHWFWKI